MLIECLFSEDSYTANSNGHVELEDFVSLLICQADLLLGAPVRSPFKAALQRLSLENRVRDVEFLETGIRETIYRGIDTMLSLLMINSLQSDVRSWERMW